MPIFLDDTRQHVNVEYTPSAQALLDQYKQKPLTKAIPTFQIREVQFLPFSETWVILLDLPDAK